MSDEAQTALEERLEWCEAQLRNVRKRMFSMGILIALLAVLLIWRTKMPHDLVRTGGAARFSTLEVVDEYGRKTVLTGPRLAIHGSDDESVTFMGCDGDPALSVTGPNGMVQVRADRIQVGGLTLESSHIGMLTSGETGGQTDIGPGFVGVSGAGGGVVADGRKEGYGVRMRDAAGKTEHLKPR